MDEPGNNGEGEEVFNVAVSWNMNDAMRLLAQGADAVIVVYPVRKYMDIICLDESAASRMLLLLPGGERQKQWATQEHITLHYEGNGQAVVKYVVASLPDSWAFRDDRPPENNFR